MWSRGWSVEGGSLVCIRGREGIGFCIAVSGDIKYTCMEIWTSVYRSRLVQCSAKQSLVVSRLPVVEPCMRRLRHLRHRRNHTSVTSRRSFWIAHDGHLNPFRHPPPRL